MKILYVTTVSTTVNAFLIPHIKMLIDHGNQVDVAFNIEQDIKPEVYDIGCKVHIISFQRSPFSWQNYKAYKSVRTLIQNEAYDLVHTHTPVASACVRLACKKFNNIKVFYTAHGFHFFKGASLLNWLIYYPVERILARYTDVLITINKEDYRRAQKSFKAGSVKYIPGVGINVTKFNQAYIDRAGKRKELGIPEDGFVAISVGELNKNKNHEVIIRALAKSSNQQIHYAICGEGLLRKNLIKLAKDLGLSDRIHLLGFRKDIFDLLKAADLFVFPSFREGLSVALMEAMAAGLPVIASKIRGNSDLIEDGRGGLLVNPKEVEGFAKAIDSLSVDNDKRMDYGNYNNKSIQQFNIDSVLTKIINLTINN